MGSSSAADLSNLHRASRMKRHTSSATYLIKLWFPVPHARSSGENEAPLLTLGGSAVRTQGLAPSFNRVRTMASAPDAVV